MILLAGADLVLTDRVVTRGSLLMEGERIVAIEPRVVETPKGAERIDAMGSLVVPGFVDVHVHGIEGHDTLDGPGAIAQVARRLPRYGVTSFCPTSIACDPATLGRMLEEIGALASDPPQHSSRVLAAHLESNFISAEYRGAQPLACLRSPRSPVTDHRSSVSGLGPPAEMDYADFSGDEILSIITKHRAQVGIVTIAPELAGGLDLVHQLAAAGHRVSIGHTGATYEQALESIDAGVCHATHLFNRMSPMKHRAPGATGAVLRSERVRAELICDGFHVHSAVMHMAIRVKSPHGIMAITDGTAGSGLPVGSRTRLGGRPILVTRRAAELEDGTLAGSVLTMDGAFRGLVQHAEVTVLDAARMCATTPAEQMNLSECGRIAVGAIADLAVLDAELRVRATYLRGQLWGNTTPASDV